MKVFKNESLVVHRVKKNRVDSSVGVDCSFVVLNFMGRGNQYIQLVYVLYCKLPAIPLEVGQGFELQSQR